MFYGIYASVHRVWLRSQMNLRNNNYISHYCFIKRCFSSYKLYLIGIRTFSTRNVATNLTDNIILASVVASKSRMNIDWLLFIGNFFASTQRRILAVAPEYFVRKILVFSRRNGKSSLVLCAVKYMSLF